MTQELMELPKNYNTIEETNQFFILNKNGNAKHTIIMKYDNGIIIDWGIMDGKWFIRKIYYPKSGFSREKIESIAYRTFNCPYCIKGVKSGSVPDIFINRNNDNNIKINNDSDNMAEDIRIIIEKLKDTFPIEFTMENYLIGQITATAVNAFIDACVEKPSQRWLKTIACITGVVMPLLSHIPQLKANKVYQKLSSISNLGFFTYLSSVFGDSIDIAKQGLADPIKEQWEDFKDFVRQTFVSQDIVSAIKERIKIPGLTSNYSVLLPGNLTKGAFAESRGETTITPEKPKTMKLRPQYR